MKKPNLIVLFLLLSTCLVAQRVEGELIRSKFPSPRVTGIDTVPVYLLLSDTCTKWIDSANGIELQRRYIHTVIWVKGYNVREVFCCVNGNTSSLMYYQPVNYYSHLYFLNEKKQRLSDCNIVWMSK